MSSTCISMLILLVYYRRHSIRFRFDRGWLQLQGMSEKLKAFPIRDKKSVQVRMAIDVEISTYLAVSLPQKIPSFLLDEKNVTSRIRVSLEIEKISYDFVPYYSYR